MSTWKNSWEKKLKEKDYKKKKKTIQINSKVKGRKKGGGEKVLGRVDNYSNFIIFTNELINFWNKFTKDYSNE